jgi:endogenous inhibitor of DNA gyrase (YacG/DUF329 family)
MSAPGQSPRPTGRIVTCPACGGDSVYSPENRYRPFCSERCKNVDLGAWASESYRLPARPGAPTSEAADDSPDSDTDNH